VRATLFYNPVAGKDRARRIDSIDQVCAVLTAHGYLPEAIATISAGSAANQVREAIANGSRYIFACGGDGTVHDVLQGLVDESVPVATQPALGIIPMGSANALARHLGLSMSPVEAAHQQMAFTPRVIPIGKIECANQLRYFTVMAGAGPDGALVYKMLSSDKQHLGRIAYYSRAAWTFASRRFPSFDLEYVESKSGEARRMRAVSTITVRIDDLGGLFSSLARGGSVHHPHLQLIAVRPPAWLSLPAWFVTSWLKIGRLNPLVRIVNVDSFTCTPSQGSRIHVQADGEWIGTAPMRVTLLQDAVRLLMPCFSPKAESQSSSTLPAGAKPDQSPPPHPAAETDARSAASDQSSHRDTH
jgi:diacylglycerol kinase (ATP)